MARTANYTAFYVDEPQSQTNLEANATRDFVYYRELQAWKGKDSSFPFNDAHDKTYNVRDDSDWEKTLKPRLHDRLGKSKNIVLFLSSITKGSKALTEEMNYGIGELGLPVIVVYPEYSEKTDIAENGHLKNQIKNLWDKLPAFKNNMNSVATIHVPMKKMLIENALKDSDFTVQDMTEKGVYFY